MREVLPRVSSVARRRDARFDFSQEMTDQV
jgi:hypothetical protein